MDINSDGLSFADWKKQVNRRVFEICGMYCDDLPDYDYYNTFLSDTTPKLAARLAITAAKGY